MQTETQPISPEVQRQEQLLIATKKLEDAINDALAEGTAEHGSSFGPREDKDGLLHAAKTALVFIPGRKNPGIDTLPKLYRVGLTMVDILDKELLENKVKYSLEELSLEGRSRIESLHWHEGEVPEHITVPGVIENRAHRILAGEVVSEEELNRRQETPSASKSKKGIARRALNFFEKQS